MAHPFSPVAPPSVNILFDITLDRLGSLRMPLDLLDLLQQLSMLPIKPCCLPLLLIQSYSLILTLSLLLDPLLAISLNLLLTLFNSFLTNQFHVIFVWLLVEVLSLLQVSQFTLFDSGEVLSISLE